MKHFFTTTLVALLALSLPSSQAEKSRDQPILKPFALKHGLNHKYLNTIKATPQTRFTYAQLRSRLRKSMFYSSSNGFTVYNIDALGDGKTPQAIFTQRLTDPANVQEDDINGIEWGCLTSTQDGYMSGGKCIYTGSTAADVDPTQQFITTWAPDMIGKAFTIRPANSKYCFGAQPDAAEKSSDFAFVSCKSSKAIWLKHDL
ncbi:MAG: hypothetical protein DHS80DRAFT_25441 [Piptocephalis tieghemiana]|nr:MAG: hypothetical protein DHS80DRAFT_25441 [Piptocephalis tieghemiana]